MNGITRLKVMTCEINKEKCIKDINHAYARARPQTLQQRRKMHEFIHNKRNTPWSGEFDAGREREREGQAGRQRQTDRGERASCLYLYRVHPKAI